MSSAFVVEKRKRAFLAHPSKRIDSFEFIFRH